MLDESSLDRRSSELENASIAEGDENMGCSYSGYDLTINPDPLSQSSAANGHTHAKSSLAAKPIYHAVKAKRCRI